MRWVIPLVNWEKRFNWPLSGRLTAKSWTPPFLQRLSYPNPAKSITFFYNDVATTLDLGLDKRESEWVIGWLQERATTALRKDG